MLNVIFLDFGDHVVLFDIDPDSGQVTSREPPGGPFPTMNAALGDFQGRVPIYPLDNGGRPGSGNAWCEFRCSGCCRPIQAVHEWVYDHRRYHNMPRPGNAPDEQDRANRRRYVPAVDQTHSVDDGQCWIGTPCVETGAEYGLGENEFQ